ncbi:MAG: ShlB/FhaC/HecB family hemolysin secretion/activation protein [Cyanobacteria bacterium P01_D01_bin.50]
MTCHVKRICLIIFMALALDVNLPKAKASISNNQLSSVVRSPKSQHLSNRTGTAKYKAHTTSINADTVGITDEINNKNHQLAQTSTQNSESEEKSQVESPSSEKESQSEENLQSEKCKDKSSSLEKVPIELDLEKYPERFYVNKINIIASTIFTSEDIDKKIREREEGKGIKDFEGQELSKEKLRQLAGYITLIYLDKGYLTSRAIITDINDGIVNINILEGSLAVIEIEGRKRLNLSYICDRIKLAVDTPLNTNKLEAQLRLLQNIDPVFEDIKGNLGPTQKDGLSKLTVTVTEANSFVAGLSVDNYSPPSVGSERFGVTLGSRNLTGLGDELIGSYNRSFTGGTELYDLSYRVPLNAMNGSLSLKAAFNKNEITQSDLKDLGIEGEKQLYDISYRQPLVRELRKEFALSLGFNYQDGQTFIFDGRPFPFGIGPNKDGVSRTSEIRFGQDYTKRDSSGTWTLVSQFGLGVGFFDATTNDAPIPDGRYLRWSGQVQRVQKLSKKNLLVMQADMQFTPNSLLPAQQFIIGGGSSVRGYRQNVRSGDNGFRLSVEDRITLTEDSKKNPQIIITPFMDMGAIWNSSNNPNELPNQTFLISAGTGLIWRDFIGMDGLNVRLNYGFPLIDLDDRGDNIQDDGLYFQVNYTTK